MLTCMEYLFFKGKYSSLNTRFVKTHGKVCLLKHLFQCFITWTAADTIYQTSGK